MFASLRSHSIYTGLEVRHPNTPGPEVTVTSDLTGSLCARPTPGDPATSSSQRHQDLHTTARRALCSRTLATWRLSCHRHHGAAALTTLCVRRLTRQVCSCWATRLRNYQTGFQCGHPVGEAQTAQAPQVHGSPPLASGAGARQNVVTVLLCIS